ncbi:rhodanese-like domain-containing protein [Bacteriovoracaceae bacterium]|nr:rhodanese-like domain-containing protein [Bacteriovoracaceae bacterium]
MSLIKFLQEHLKRILVIACVLSMQTIDCKENKSGPIRTRNVKFDRMLRSFIDEKKVPIMKVDTLAKIYKEKHFPDKYVIIDSRESVEYNVSHLSQSRLYSEDSKYPQGKTIIIYCSVGYRSQNIGKKLLEKGYKVFNLYGGIFEWSNSKLPLVDESNKQTIEVHGYNKSWSQWIENGKPVLTKSGFFK